MSAYVSQRYLQTLDVQVLSPEIDDIDATLVIQSPSENGFMEPKYLAEEVIVHPNHALTRWLDP